MRPSDGMDEIIVSAPTSGRCPLCADKHDEREPHNRDSLYYQQKFYRLHKRFPTWADAMAHCSTITQAAFREKLKKRGIEVQPIAEDTKA